MSPLEICVAAIVSAAEALGPANVEINEVRPMAGDGKGGAVLTLDVLIRYLDPGRDQVERKQSVVTCQVDSRGGVSVK